MNFIFYKKTENYLLFFILILSVLVLAEFTKFWLGIDNLVYNNLLSNYDHEKAGSILKNIEKWELISYLAVPIFIFIKVQIITLILNMGMFFSEVELKERIILSTVLKAEFIFVFSGFIRVIMLSFNFDNPNLNLIQTYSILSLSNFFDLDQISTWYHYPLKIISIFECIYIIFLIFFISKEAKIKIKKGLLIVASSYIPALILWLTILVFIRININ